MTELRISSLPLLELTQQAYESYVMQQHCALQHEYNITIRTGILARIAQANEMINHIIEVTKNIQKDV